MRTPLAPPRSDRLHTGSRTFHEKSAGPAVRTTAGASLGSTGGRGTRTGTAISSSLMNLLMRRKEAMTCSTKGAEGDHVALRIAWWTVP